MGAIHVLAQMVGYHTCVRWLLGQLRHKSELQTHASKSCVQCKRSRHGKVGVNCHGQLLSKQLLTRAELLPKCLFCAVTDDADIHQAESLGECLLFLMRVVLQIKIVYGDQQAAGFRSKARVQKLSSVLIRSGGGFVASGRPFKSF